MTLEAGSSARKPSVIGYRLPRGNPGRKEKKRCYVFLSACEVISPNYNAHLGNRSIRYETIKVRRNADATAPLSAHWEGTGEVPRDNLEKDCKSVTVREVTVCEPARDVFFQEVHCLEGASEASSPMPSSMNRVKKRMMRPREAWVTLEVAVVDGIVARGAIELTFE